MRRVRRRWPGAGVRPPLDLAALLAAPPSRFVTGLADLLERRVTLALEAALAHAARFEGPAYDPLRYSWRAARAGGRLGPNRTGRWCPRCGAVTYGGALACGSCGRLWARS